MSLQITSISIELTFEFSKSIFFSHEKEKRHSKSAQGQDVVKTGFCCVSQAKRHPSRQNSIFSVPFSIFDELVR